jgi:hypothetical protein
VSPLFVYNLPVRRYVIPRFSDMIFIVVLAGAVLLGQRLINTDGDLGRHLTLGQYILSSGSIPVNDILSWTKAGQPRPPYEWLAQVVFAAANRVWGLDGVVLTTSLLIASAFAVVYVDAARRAKAPILALGVVVWAILASSLHWLARPHVFSFLLFAVWLANLEQIRIQRSSAIWPFPVLMLIWANTHGGFVFAFLAWGAYVVGWLRESGRHSAKEAVGARLAAIGGASLVASVITPDYWHNWEAVFANTSPFILSHTVETLPANFSTPSIWVFLGLLSVVLIAAAMNSRRVELAHGLMLAGLAVASLAMARNIPLFAIAAAPIAAVWLTDLGQDSPKWRQLEVGFSKQEAASRGHVWPALAMLSAAAIFSIHRLAWRSSIFYFSRAVFPVEAADWMAQHPAPGAMYNDFNWGGYLLYRIWPQQRVFVDSQSDFYGEPFLRRYEKIYTASSDWQAALDALRVEAVIIPTAGRLAAELASSPGWHIAYEDPTATIYERR